MKKVLFLFVVVLVFAPLWCLDEAKAERESCKICGMYIDRYHDTSCELVQKDGKQSKTCGVACMIRQVNDAGGPGAFTSIMVHGWDNKQLLPADKAAYVIGSKLVPDMIPNLIAFSSKQAAEEFIAKQGGKMLDFTQALLSIAPMGMTMPVRLKTAVTSPKGNYSVGVGHMRMVMDEVQLGSNSVDPRDFVRRPGQMMGPKEMRVDAEMMMITYGVTNNISAGLYMAYFNKDMERYKNGGRTTEKVENSGFGDIGVNLRYNLWKDVYYSKFFTLFGETSIPTGDFDQALIASPGLQIGTGAFTFTGGPLFSHRIGSFWFHYLASYTATMENHDDYKFGNTTRAGAAIHYTPTYNFMTGLEGDLNYYEKSEFRDVDVGNTGGFRSYLAGVVDYRFLTALGGNFSVRLTGGIPVYEDMNHFRDGASEKVQMGGGYFVNAMVTFRSSLPWFRDY